MRVHVVRHAPFEGPALIGDWARQRRHQLTEAFALTEEHPSAEEVDFLVVMGGPMSADDHAGNPWLIAEKRFVADVLAAEKLVLGVCLGAQIVAQVAGGAVRRNDYAEIGWYPVKRTPESAEDAVFSAFPDRLVVGHWHGDTFSLPPGARHLASSAACANQAFSLGDGRVLGLQFHLEWDLPSIEALVAACAEEIAEAGSFVMQAPDFLAQAKERTQETRTVLWNVLDAMERVRNRGREDQ